MSMFGRNLLAALLFTILVSAAFVLGQVQPMMNRAGGMMSVGVKSVDASCPAGFDWSFELREREQKSIDGVWSVFLKTVNAYTSSTESKSLRGQDTLVGYKWMRSTPLKRSVKSDFGSAKVHLVKKRLSSSGIPYDQVIALRMSPGKVLNTGEYMISLCKITGFDSALIGVNKPSTPKEERTIRATEQGMLALNKELYCSNGLKDFGEVSVDCGGPCSRSCNIPSSSKANSGSLKRFLNRPSNVYPAGYLA